MTPRAAGVRRIALLSWLCLACGETAELRAWAEHRAALERRQAELGDLETHRAEVEASSAQQRLAWTALRESIDVAAFLREHGVTAQVFVEPGVVRVKFAGTTPGCRDTLEHLAPLRWLISRWRLRLDGAQCEWEGMTTSEFPGLERALVLATPRWTPPPPSFFSRGLAEERGRVAVLEAEVALSEGRLGVLATLDQLGRAALQAGAQLERLKSAPPPCDLAIVERELAQDLPGALLEVTERKLVHPLEPRGDARLRGLVDVEEGGLRWHCE